MRVTCTGGVHFFETLCKRLKAFPGQNMRFVHTPYVVVHTFLVQTRLFIGPIPEVQCS